jgi:hypothetical protein
VSSQRATPVGADWRAPVGLRYSGGNVPRRRATDRGAPPRRRASASIWAIAAVVAGGAGPNAAVGVARAADPPELRTPVPSPRLHGPRPFEDSDAGASGLGLARLDDGSYTHVDPAGRFTVLVRPDGRVRFADRWRRPDDRDAQHGRCCGRPSEGVLAALNPFSGIDMAGPVEWMLRGTGHDRATAAKMAVLERTEDFRIKLAIAWARTNLAERLRALPGDLEALWNDDSIPVERRREILFEHWDACEDRLGVDTEGLPHDAVAVVDRERLAAATRARVVIVRFVRLRLGPESEAAYRSPELARLNARRASVEAFAPYDLPDSIPPRSPGR